jgi:asparagine synthase (glutamine-hydrolysing)
MSEVLAHRGPDGVEVWRDGPLGIGHLMFHTTPESLFEEQPLVARGGQLVLTADARIDNREELIRALGFAGREAWKVTDADLILAAYERWSDRCAEHLLGDFAFVIWDQARESLLCVRDHFGMKPLYYFHVPGRLFAFASEVKALLTLAEMSHEIDELEVARHLVIPVREDPGATSYREARRVQPAHTLTVGRDAVREQEYWRLDPKRSLELRSDEEYAGVVRETFLEAVRCRLRSSADVACMLSGGIDSSSITCAAAQLLQQSGRSQPLQTLSAVYDVASESDEREYVKEVVRTYNIRPHFFSADTVSPLADEDRLSWLIDGPCVANNLYLNWNLYRSAADRGIRVVLDGFDGDSTVSHGRGRLFELANQRKWWTLLREVKAYAETTGTPWKPAVRSWIVTFGLKPLARRFRRRENVRPPRPPLWTRMLKDDYRARLEQHLEEADPPPRTEREMHYRLVTRPTQNKFAGYLEAVGAGAGVEVRLPFFDVRLVELCLSLPAEQKLRRGWSRFVMRNAMAGILPEMIRERRKKSDVGVGFRHAVRSFAEVKMEDVVQSANGELSRYIDPGYVANMAPRYMNGSVSRFEKIYFWRVSAFARWLMGKTEQETLAVAPPGPAKGKGTVTPLALAEEVRGA